ncbi:hypothetical protein ACHQM5_025762 [Ranunculus cassubicifolius]
MMSPCFGTGDRKYWWLTNIKAVDIKYLRDARVLIATREESDMISALNLIDLALALSPQSETALQLKATTLLNMRRFKQVANLLQQHIPSYNKMLLSQQSDNTSQVSREEMKLLPRNSSAAPPPSVKCFSVSRLIADLYYVLGEACCHLGLMEDAMILLQTGKRLSSAAFRRESVSLSDDRFTMSNNAAICSAPNNTNTPVSLPVSEADRVSRLLSQIKLLVGRRTAALAALDAGLYAEAIRHFSKILENHRGTPQGFLAECYVHRAEAYRAAGRFADSIADCNRTLVLDPTCLPALTARASLLEAIRCLPDCLRDLEHLKSLYTSILRDRKLPGPLWKRQHIKYDDVPSILETLSNKIQELKQRVESGEVGSVDYYALIGLRRGCTRSELERARLLLCLRHRPDKAANFIGRCEYVDDRDIDTVKDQAKMMALMLYRLIQKGYSSVMNIIMDEEAAERQRLRATAAALQAATAIQVPIRETKFGEELLSQYRDMQDRNSASVMQGAFCRDIAVVGNLLSQVGFTRQIPINYEALSC